MLSNTAFRRTVNIPFINVKRRKNDITYEATRPLFYLHINADGFIQEANDKNQNNARIDIDLCQNQKISGHSCEAGTHYV